MNDIERIGGWSAILLGIAILVAIGLFIPTYAAMPADAMQPANLQARLAAMDSLGPPQRATLALGFALEVVAGVLMFPALLAVHGATKDKSQGRAVLALGMAAVGIAFLILGFSLGLSLLQLSDGFAGAGEVAQAACVTTYRYTEELGLQLERLFWLFFVWSAILWFGLMRDTVFPRWLAWVGLGAALVGVIGILGGVVVPTLDFISPLALLLLVVWFVGAGVRLLRSGRA